MRKRNIAKREALNVLAMETQNDVFEKKEDAG